MIAKKWLIITSKGKNLPILLIDCLLDSLKDIGRLHGFEFNPTHYRQLDASRWLIEEEQLQWLNTLKQQEEKNPGWLLEIMTKFKKSLDEFRNEADKLAGDFKQHKAENKIPSDFLTKSFRNIMAIAKETISYDYDYYFMNQFYLDSLVEEINSKVTDPTEINDYLEILLASDKLSETYLEKIDLIQISQVQDPQILDQKINEHLQKYRHLGMFYFEKSPFSKPDILSRIEEIKSSHHEFSENRTEIPQKSAEIIKKLNLSEESQLKIKTLKETAYVVNYFDESWNYACCRLLDFFHEIANRLGMTYQQLIWLTQDEIIEGLTNKLTITPEEIEKRIEDHLFLWENGKKTILAGKPLQEYKQKEYSKSEEITQISELHGTVACGGHAKGKARILLSPDQIIEMQKGEILVAKMTAPSFVPAMEKAAAFIVEQGGLLCHTAIVGREMKKPTIVGLKDLLIHISTGDELIIDADKGIVKIIKG